MQVGAPNTVKGPNLEISRVDFLFRLSNLSFTLCVLKKVIRNSKSQFLEKCHLVGVDYILATFCKKGLKKFYGDMKHP